MLPKALRDKSPPTHTENAWCACYESIRSFSFRPLTFESCPIFKVYMKFHLLQIDTKIAPVSFFSSEKYFNS